MSKLFNNISCLVTIDNNKYKYKAGKEMNNINVIHDAALVFDNKFKWIGKASEVNKEQLFKEFGNLEEIDCKGKTIFPGFVDSHTHIVFAGNRSNEFAKRLRGATYQEIAAEGGGIIASVNATRKASLEELVDNGRGLIHNAIKHGTVAFEIKSGYGLNLESELKQLRAIKALSNELPVHISSTFLGAHDFPPEYKNNIDKYMDILCKEMIPLVADEKLADYCDAFVDKGYYTIKQGERILQTALDNGLKVRLHCDELAQFGSAELASKMGAISADHLLYISDEGIESLKNSNTIATLLPGTAYYIRMPYAPARKIIDSGCITALATDCNPGSCFTENMQIIMSLAVINMKMTAEEAFTAATLNSAAAIEQSDRIGSIEVGKDASFGVADVNNYTDLFYHFGINHVVETWIRGSRFDYSI